MVCLHVGIIELLLNWKISVLQWPILDSTVQALAGLDMKLNKDVQAATLQENLLDLPAILAAKREVFEA